MIWASVVSVGQTHSAALRGAYEATTYRAILPSGDITIRIGKTCHALDELLSAFDVTSWAFVSAANPGSTLVLPAENDARHDALLERVRSLGFPWFPGWGEPDAPGWESEPSVLIIGIPCTRAVQLARVLEQNAIVCGERCGRAMLAWC